MARMRAIDAAVLVLEKEGITCAFGIPAPRSIRSTPH
jgi:tartronate-semialdehyde synthase